MQEKVQILLNNITNWVKTEPSLLGAALVGSYANDKANTDSDVDLVLLSSSPEKLINNKEWIKDFGSVKSLKIEVWGMLTSIRVFYKEGLEVEYGLTPEAWVNSPLDDGTRQVISDCMIILLDKKGLLNRALEEVINSK